MFDRTVDKIIGEFEEDRNYKGNINIYTLKVIRVSKDAVLRIKSERKKGRNGSNRVKKLKINFTTIEGKRR